MTRSAERAEREDPLPVADAAALVWGAERHGGRWLLPAVAGLVARTCAIYALFMSWKRITISVPAEIAAKAARAAEAGEVESVSAYFAGLAAREPDWVEARAVIDEMIAEAGGISDEDLAWARSVLGGDAGTDAA